MLTSWRITERPLKIDEHTQWMTVIGVARSLRYENLDGFGRRRRGVLYSKLAVASE